MELCFVVNLTKDGNWAITWPPTFATGYASFATAFFISGSKYLQKKLIFNTDGLRLSSAVPKIQWVSITLTAPMAIRPWETLTFTFYITGCWSVKVNISQTLTLRTHEYPLQN